MKKLHPDFIEEVKQRADIVEVVSSYVSLKKAGKELSGCCPFHNESTPSFTVTPDKGLAYCFGCSWGGDSIKFLREVGRVSYAEAVLELARSANIPVKYEDGSTEYDYPDPLPRPLTPLSPVVKEEQTPAKDYTVDEWRVNRSVQQLLSGTGDAAKALAWLESRRITRSMVKRYRLGLEKRVVTPDQSKPDDKKEYWAIAIFIPVADRPGRFYVKKRVAPWLTGDERPEYLAKWAQFGVPATIWFTYNPPEATQTYFTEGEWDAMILGELARQRGEKVAVACSTSGAGTIPKPEQLDRLPGQVTTFYDRDEAGEKGAQKLAAALGERGWIASVPMPADCQIKGWDVSNAIQSGYGWEDLEAAPVTQPKQQIEVTSPNEQGIRFKVLRKSLDQLLDIFPELETEAGKDWLKMREFTPDYTINSKYFDWQSDKPGINLAVRSGLGTGKTYHVHHKFLSDDDMGANAFGYRNSLLIQFAERGNETKEGGTCKNPWYHLQQDLKESKDDLLLVADPSSRIAACFDSLIYFKPHHFEGKRLILDEIEGGFRHLYQSKTAVSLHRHVCKERAGQAIANSEAAIILDGNLTDLTVAHAERISGKKFTKVENLYRGNRGKVTFYTGTLKFGKDEETGQTIVTERRINDYSLLHKMMMEDTEPFVCGSDSQEKLEAWHEVLRSKGRKVFRLDGSNSSSPEAKKFLADPVKYIQDNGIEIILYSPTAESGLSIDLEGYFKRSYYFFFGVVQTNEQTQFLARLRDPNTHIHVFCQNQGIGNGKTELTAEHIQETFIDYTLACSRISLADIGETEKQQLIVEEVNKLIQRSADPHFQYECHLKAKEVFERNHLRKCLEYALYSAGYQVEVVTGFKVSQQKMEAAQEAVQLRKSLEIFQAQPLTDKEANDKARKFDATQQDKLEVARHRLVSRLPGIENKTFTTSKVVTLLQASVDEIKSGRVSLETAQKLGIPIPETPITQRLEVGHLSQNSLNNQGEGVPTSPGEDFNRSGGFPVEEGTDPGQSKTDQNQGGAKSETPTTPAIELGHLMLNFSINQGEGVPVSEESEVEVVITETKPVFDPEFIRKVKYQDRAWLSKVELHFLVQHPEVAKLLQQRRWYKKLQVFSDPNEPDYVKRLNLTTYKSDWLKIHTLLEMGIEFFLNPESRWTQDTPEAIEFWEKGKDARRARYIGTSVGDSNPCEYIGRVLDKIDVKRKRERVKNDAGDKIRVYRVDTDYLSSPMRKAVYECVQQRIESTLQSDSVVLNWDVIVENKWAAQTDRKLDISTPETPTMQGLELGHLPHGSLNHQGEGVPASDPTADLAEALPSCQSPADFTAVIESYESSQVEDAIALQDSQPRRQRFDQWYADWKETIKVYGQLLVEGFEYGIEAIQELLKPWTLRVRREALLEFEALAPEKMGQLAAIAPNWMEWCDA
ncbi:MAG TPA: plasmid replication protein, CyRepA1 family [Allocoleopsis sp.]